MSIYVEEMLAQIEKLDAFCERLQKRMQVDPVPIGLEVEADELISRIKEVEQDLPTGLTMGDWGRKAHFIRYYLRRESPVTARATSRCLGNETSRPRRKR